MFFSYAKIILTKEFRKLFFKLIKTPLFMLAFMFGTIYSVYVCQKIYPNIHSGNGKANAFRHAFWNSLIFHFCLIFSSNIIKVIKFTQEITDFHEVIFPNDAKYKKMDLHNNTVGIKQYEKLLLDKKNTINNIKKILLEKSKKAIKITDIYADYPDDTLIYLE